MPGAIFDLAGTSTTDTNDLAIEYYEAGVLAEVGLRISDAIGQPSTSY